MRKNEIVLYVILLLSSIIITIISVKFYETRMEKEYTCPECGHVVTIRTIREVVE